MGYGRQDQAEAAQSFGRAESATKRRWDRQDVGHLLHLRAVRREHQTGVYQEHERREDLQNPEEDIHEKSLSFRLLTISWLRILAKKESPSSLGCGRHILQHLLEQTAQEGAV